MFYRGLYEGVIPLPVPKKAVVGFTDDVAVVIICWHPHEIEVYMRQTI